jgi:tetratricopeptide (TPR) repeat protein
MSMKSKSVKRLIVLSCAAVVVLGGLAGAYVFRKFQVREQLAHDRSEGLAAMQQKDYPKAVKDLGEYLSQRPNDIEAQKAYVLARPQVGAGDIQEVKDTLMHLRQLVLLDPSLSDARRQLMNIYWRYGYAPETEEQALALLQKNPKDTEALKFLLFTKLRLRGEELTGSPSKHIASAQDIAERWAAADPGNPDPDFLILDLMKQSGQTSVQILDRARQLGGSNPKSPLAELVLGEAYRITGDRATATQLLKSAAAQPMPSVEFAKILAQQLNVMGLYHDSMQLLQKQAKTNNDPAIAEELANRQWEMGQSAQVIALTDGFESRLSTQGKAIRGMALLATGKKPEAEAIEHELAQTGTPLGDAWALILKQIDTPAEVTARQLADTCETALKSETADRDAYLQYFLAEGYEHLGERELAIDELTKAAQTNPTWTVPLVMLSRLELERERPAVALEAATVAWQRSQQTNVAAAIAIAQAWAVFSETSNQASGSSNAGPPAQLMQLVNEMHQKLPHEQQVLGMYISLLCQSKPSRVDEAKTEIRRALTDDSSLSEDALIRLAFISRQYQLGVTDECYALSQKKFGMTASLAYAKATNKYINHDAAGGLALLQKARAENAKPDNALNWDLANARYLELTGDPHAAATWIALGDANPNNLGIQQTILQIHSIATNRDFLSRTIERVHNLTGDNAITWKLAKARLILSGTGFGGSFARSQTDHQPRAGSCRTLRTARGMLRPPWQSV